MPSGDAYEPEPVERFQALLVLSTDNPAKADLEGAWRRLLEADQTIAEVDGHHFTMMGEPSVAGLTRNVREWLEWR